MGAARRLDRHHVSRRPARRRPAGGDPRSRPGDDRRAPHAADRHPARPGPQRRAAGPVPAPARRRRQEAHAIVEFSTLDTGLTPYAWKSVRYEPGAQQAAVAKALADADIAEQIASGDVVVVAGRPNLAESPDATIAALQRSSTAVPARRCCRRCGAATWSARSRSAWRRSMPPTTDLATLRAAAEGKLELLILLGADPLNDCPDADLARRALAGARRVISIDTLPVRVHQARRRRAGRRPPTARRPAPPPTSKVASPRWPRRSPRPAPPDPTG